VAATIVGAPVTVQGAPVTVQGAPVYVQGAPVTIQGAPVTQVGQPVYVQGQPTYIQGTAVPASPVVMPVFSYVSTASPVFVQGFTTTTMASQRYFRDSRAVCLDAWNNNQPVLSTLCPIRRSQRSVEASQAIPYVAALTVCGGIMIVVALVASVVVLARRTISKRLEMRFREHGLEMRS